MSTRSISLAKFLRVCAEGVDAHSRGECWCILHEQTPHGIVHCAQVRLRSRHKLVRRPDVLSALTYLWWHMPMRPPTADELPAVALLCLFLAEQEEQAS